MRTVGQILKEAREDKSYTLEDVERQTKIRVELLEALEADNFRKLPPETFIQGFIKNYGTFLGLDTKKLLAIFRRDYEQKKHPPVILESFSRPINTKKFSISPQRVLVLGIGLVIIGFFAYLWLEYRQFVGAPNLSLSSPQDQQTVDVPSVLIEGTTDPEAKVAVNDQDIGVDKSGHFQEDIKLSQSVNKLTISASSKFGQTAKKEVTVFVKKE